MADGRLEAAPDRELEAGEWDAFCARSDDAWFFHTQDWLSYSLAHRPDWHARSRSFVLRDREGIVAACPLVEESVPEPGGGGVKEFSRSHGGIQSCPAPVLRPGLGSKRRQQVLEAAFSHVDGLARAHGVARVTMRAFALAPASLRGGLPSNPFPRHGYLEASLATQLIDLRLPEDQVWAGLTRGHRYDARRGAGALELQAMGQGDEAPAAFEAYRLLHAKAAGRAPRPAQTYAEQARWLREGNALLVGARRSDAWVAFAYFLVHKSGAYYMSGCEDPDGPPTIPVGHALQWKAIQALRERNVATYEIGWQYFTPQPHHLATEKEMGISAFKRRFGGRTVQLWSGEKFYSGEFLRRAFAQRADALAALLGSPAAEDP